MKTFNQSLPLTSSFIRLELSWLLGGRLGTLHCRAALRRGKLSLDLMTTRWTRRRLGMALWASPRLNNTSPATLRVSLCPTQVLDTISLFNHVLRDLGGPTDLSYFFQGL